MVGSDVNWDEWCDICSGFPTSSARLRLSVFFLPDERVRICQIMNEIFSKKPWLVGWKSLIVFNRNKNSFELPYEMNGMPLKRQVPWNTHIRLAQTCKWQCNRIAMENCHLSNGNTKEYKKELIGFWLHWNCTFTILSISKNLFWNERPKTFYLYFCE